MIDRVDAHTMPTDSLKNPSDPVSYLDDGKSMRSWLLTTDHKRIAILYVISITFFFLRRSLGRTSGSAGIDDTAWRLVVRGHLQQVVLAARHRDGMVLFDPGRSQRAGQFSDSADDRRS